MFTVPAPAAVRGRKQPVSLRLTDAQAQRIRIRIAADPVWFAEHILGVKLLHYQKTWLRAVRDYKKVAIKTCHGVGKSFTAAIAALWYLAAHPGSEIVTTAPGQRQVKTILWKNIKDLARNARIPLGGELLEVEMRLAPEWFAIGFTADNPDRFVGLHPKSGIGLVVVDEAAGVEEQIFKGAIPAITSSEHSHLLLIANPTSDRGTFRDAFLSPKSTFQTYSMSVFESPNFLHFGITEEDLHTGAWRKKVVGRSPYPAVVQPDWAAGILGSYGPTDPDYIARVLAKFSTAGEKGVFPVEWIEGACHRHIPAEGPLRWGVDVGGSGQDPSIVMACYDNGRFRTLMTEQQSKMHELAARLESLAQTTARPPQSINIDSAGIGASLCEMLNVDETGRGWIMRPDGIEIPIHAVNVGASETAEHQPITKAERRYRNLRAELMFNFRRRAELGKLDIDINDVNLRLDMTDIRWERRLGLIHIEEKDQFRARVGRSPDRLDACIIGNAEIEPFTPFYGRIGA